jgi:hypothetical protein
VAKLGMGRREGKGVGEKPKWTSEKRTINNEIVIANRSRDERVNTNINANSCKLAFTRGGVLDIFELTSFVIHLLFPIHLPHSILLIT